MPTRLDVYFVALYVYTPAEIEMTIPTGFAVKSLLFDGDRFSTSDWITISSTWRITAPGVYGWFYEDAVPFRVVSGEVLITMKQGALGTGKDPWPPPPPPPPPFAAIPRAVKRWPVHACASHEECLQEDGKAIPSELFLAAIGG